MPRRLTRAQSQRRFAALKRAGCRPRRVRLASGDEVIIKDKGCPLNENPKQPPKHWWRGCVRGVRDSGSAADPESVCGSLWHHKLSDKQRRTILKAEGKMQTNAIVKTDIYGHREQLIWKSENFSTLREARRVASKAEREFPGNNVYIRSTFHRRKQWRVEVRAPGTRTPRRRSNPTYQPNQAASGTLLAIGGVAAAIGILVWNARRKRTAVAQPPLPRAPLPRTDPRLPPAPEPLPEPRAVPPPGCPVAQDLLDQWGQSRGLSVFYFSLQQSPPDWTQMLMIPTIPDIVSAPGGLFNVVVVMADGSFWAFTGTPPVPGPAPAQRDDYCQWNVQQGNA